MKVRVEMEAGDIVARVVIEEGKSVTERMLSLDHIQEIFSQGKTSVYRHPISLFKEESIPGLLLGKTSLADVEGIFFVEGDIRYMNFAGEKFTLPYPSLLFYLYSHNGVLIDSKCVAVEASAITDIRKDMPLYAFPFGNVFPYDAHICWGSNKMKGLDGYAGLGRAVAIFFSSESNKDYVSERSYHGNPDYQEFLRELQGFSYFPAGALEKSSCYENVGEFLRLIELSEWRDDENE